jgi:hypothetical protein
LSPFEWLVLIAVVASVLIVLGMIGATGEGSSCDSMSEGPAYELCLRNEAKGILPTATVGAGFATAAFFLALRAARHKRSRHNGLPFPFLVVAMGLSCLVLALMIVTGVTNTSTPFGPYSQLDRGNWWRGFVVASAAGVLVGLLLPGGRRARPMDEHESDQS